MYLSDRAASLSPSIVLRKASTSKVLKSYSRNDIELPVLTSIRLNTAQSSRITHSAIVKDMYTGIHIPHYRDGTIILANTAITASTKGMLQLLLHDQAYLNHIHQHLHSSITNHHLIYTSINTSSFHKASFPFHPFISSPSSQKPFNLKAIYMYYM